MSRQDKYDAKWPPEDGKRFIRSEEFGQIVLTMCQELGQRYARMDFSDGASQVFDWFDRTLSKNRRFVNARRFRTKSAFVAYVRQCIWNAARQTERDRQRHNRIVALPIDKPIAAEGINPDEFAALLEAVDKLPYPHAAILKRIVFDEDDKAMIAADYHFSVSRVTRIYIEAIDLLGQQFQ